MSDSIELIARARAHRGRIAITDDQGWYTYVDLLGATERVAARLLRETRDLAESRVAFLAPPSVHYVATQWGIWRAGGVAVPLCITHPAAELAHVLDDSGATVVMTHPDYEDTLRPLAEARGLPLIGTDDALGGPGLDGAELPTVADHRRAMMVYTSGTTARPKGVVTTHAAIRAQVTSLVDAWAWQPDDHILLTLPLHHVHGIVNVLTCALWAGAHCEMLPTFDADRVWARLCEGDLSLFMAVPVIYRRLISAWDEATPERREAMSSGSRFLRLMVSGSAALPVATLERWRKITGHTLLERYGMTETGMILSNPLDGERVPGWVGGPLPGVEVRLVSDAWGEVADGEPGTILVRGPGLFTEYWGDTDATRQAFYEGWFVTGDVAVREQGRYRILGRKSVDIINTGGYKVSALEVEEVLRQHPSIQECAVVGVGDDEWGERICAAAEVADDLDLASLRKWTKRHLAAYKIPRSLLTVEALPRNAMGKVVKAEVKRLFETDA